MLRVIDISDAQADLDLSTIANQFDAVIIKATGGNGYVNPSCDWHVQQAIALGKKWGVYHYFSDGFNTGSPEAEGSFFADNCRGYLGQGQIWLDWERGGNPFVSRVDMALAWLEHVRTTTGVKPAGMYMSLSIIQAYDWSPVIDAGYALWCAAYVDNNTPILNFGMDPSRDPNPRWDGIVNDVLWQFTSTGRLSGYGGNLDCSFFYGPYAAWDAYAGTNAGANAAPAPIPATTTTTTEAPQPPTTTTTTTQAEPTTSTDTATTTTTTTQLQPAPPRTTTTTTQAPYPPGRWAGIWALIKAVFNALFGKVEE